MPDPTIPPPLTSYARNFEDVLLWRALKEIEAGFYLDIGAGDPVLGSVSLAFYERGWRGLTVEQDGQFADKLRAARPDEEITHAVVSPTPGPAPAMRLDALLDKAGGRDIHWMRIAADQALESWGESAVRPWVVVVESTRPRTQEDSAGWEPLLLEKGYRPVHFDGLNRFYVSEAHADLAARFTTGPNTFDDFVLAETSYFARPQAAELRALRLELTEKNSYCQALETARANDLVHIRRQEEALDHFRRDLAEFHQTGRLQQEAIDRERADFIRHQSELLQRHDELQHAAAATTARLAAIESSRSWRWTGALRRIVRLLKGRP